ncbi:reverse transcriptase domain-containing protein [Tanacetum coccineum]
MSTNEQTPLSQPTSVVRNTLGKEQAQQDLVRPISDEALREYYDKNYHQILPIIAEMVHQEKVQQEKLKAVKARLNFEETSRHSESGTPSRRRSLKERLEPRHARSMSGSPEPRHGRSKSPREKGPERRTMFKRLEKGVFHRLGDKEKNVYAHLRDSRHRAEALSESEGSVGGHWKSKQKKQKSSVEDDLSQPWFDDLLRESIDSYNDLRKAFLKNYLQQKKCIKNPVEIHNIKQRDRESTEEFVLRYKLECRDMKGAPECMKISRFIHEITNPELIKRLHDKIPKSVDEMMRVTTTFLRGEVVASNRERKNSFPSWKQQEAGHKQNFKKGSFQNQQRTKQKQDRFTLLTKTPKEILALDKGKFKPPPLMTTLANRGNAKGRKAVTFNKEIEAKQWKRSSKGSKKGGNLREGQVAGDIDGTTMAKSSQTENYLNLLFEVSNFFSTSRGGRWDRGFHPEVRNQMIPATTPLVRFSGEIIWPLGQISLLVKIGDEEYSTFTWMKFMVVRSPSPYNGIIGRPGVRKIQAVPSTAHGMLKFSVAGGTITLQSSRIILLECIMVSGPGVSQPVISQVTEEKIQVAIHPKYPKQTIAVGSTLTEEGRKELCGLLRCNLDVFSWKPADMTGVPRHIAEHKLNIREGYFKDFNKSCPKDGYQLPEVDWKISRNLEVYVDDLVIKSQTEEEVIRDIEETFKTLREINMKLNLKKCAFGMRKGTFLGYKVDTDGLRLCPDKVEAVLSLPSPKCLKDVQKLNGKLASLNRFLSKSAKKSLPFSKTLKKCTKKSDFQWIAEAEMAFKQIKRLIAELPMLMAPKEKEELIMYLAAAKEAISMVLIAKRDEKQTPIYFISRALQGPKINYTPMEKLILALMLSNPKVAGRLLKWRFELEEHAVHYRPRTSVNGQFLAEFIVEHPEDDPLDTIMEDKEEFPDPWILFTNGSSCIDGFGAGLIITNPKGMKFTYALRFRFSTTNNEAEYEDLIAGLRIAEQIGVKNLQANVDSKLMANQVNGVYMAKEPGMIKYLDKVKNLANAFKEFSIKQVPRGENKKAEALSKMASTSFAHLSKQVLVEELKEKSIDEKEVLAVVEEEGHTWMTPIYEYLTEEILPEEKRNARAIRRKAGSNGETLFSLTYGTEAVIPVEIGMPTIRMAEIDMIKNGEALEINLDPLEEKREQATIQEAKSQAKMEKYYNARVRSISFRPGVLVYRSNKASRAEDGGKMGLNVKDHVKSRKHWTKGRTGLGTAIETLFRGHGTPATLRNAMGMKWTMAEEAKVVERVVMGASEVLTSPVRLLEDKGSIRGVMTSEFVFILERD